MNPYRYTSEEISLPWWRFLQRRIESKRQEFERYQAFILASQMWIKTQEKRYWLRLEKLAEVPRGEFWDWERMRLTMRKKL